MFIRWFNIRSSNFWKKLRTEFLCNVPEHKKELLSNILYVFEEQHTNLFCCKDLFDRTANANTKLKYKNKMLSKELSGYRKILNDLKFKK